MIRTALLLAAAAVTAFGWWATQQVVVPAVGAQPDNRWVRTANGWEHPRWEASETRYEPRLHPTLTAGLFAFASALALLALPVRGRRVHDPEELVQRRAASRVARRLTPLTGGRK